MKVKTNNKYEGLITTAYVFSILGGIFAIITFALSIWGCCTIFINHDSIVNTIRENLLKNDSSLSYAVADSIANGTWMFLCILSICLIAWSIYACTVNWIGLAYVKRTQLTGLYSLTSSIFQIIAFPWGTVSGILMLVARNKNRKKEKSTKSKKSKH